MSAIFSKKDTVYLHMDVEKGKIYSLKNIA